MTRNCPKIHFNIVKNYVSAERKVIRHVINDVITNYTEPRGVDTTLDDFIRKINSILLRGVDISPNNFVRKINSILPPKHELLPCDFVQKINSILPPKHELLPCDFVQKLNFKYPYKKGSPTKELPIFLLLVFYSIFQSTLLLSILQSQDL